MSGAIERAACSRCGMYDGHAPDCQTLIEARLSRAAVRYDTPVLATIKAFGPRCACRLCATIAAEPARARTLGMRA